jgi:hypothetical protein
MKLIKVALVSVLAFPLCAAVNVHARSSVSVSRPSVSVSRPATSTTRSYSRTTYTASKPRVVSTRSTSTVEKKRKAVEYDYYALRDCERIIKPINGYRCIDRD